MAKLGQIEAVAKQLSGERDTFEMLGEEFEVRHKPSAVDSMLSAAITADENLSEGEKLSRLTDFANKLLKKSLTPEAFTRFMVVVEENELGIDVVWDTIKLLVGAAAGRPTGKSSDSSDGQSNTSTSSSSEPVDSKVYEAKGLRLVTAEDWADRYLKTA